MIVWAGHGELLQGFQMLRYGIAIVGICKMGTGSGCGSIIQVRGDIGPADGVIFKDRRPGRYRRVFASVCQYGHFDILPTAV